MNLQTIILLVTAAFLPGHLSAATLSDFEPSTYTAGDTINGTGGWMMTPNFGRVTPDALNTGYTAVIAGAQSGYLGGDARLSFASVGPELTRIDSFSYLFAMPSAPYASQDFVGFYFENKNNLSRVAGIGLNFFDAGGGIIDTQLVLRGTTDLYTGQSIITGGGGTPNLSAAYQFSIQFDYVTHTMAGYLQQWDINTNSLVGSATLLGAVGIDDVLTGTILRDDYQLYYRNPGWATIVDNVSVNSVVPEPSVGILLALGVPAILLNFRRAMRRSFKGSKDLAR